jgi:3D (Asp-Asp-Asp) domain-containing protein
MSLRTKKVFAASALVLCMLFTTGFTDAGGRNVTINADGKSMTLRTRYTSPELILNQAGIRMNHKDEFQLDKHDSQKEEITIYRAVPVTLQYRGQSREVYTSKQTVGDALKELGYDQDAYSADLDLNTKITTNLRISVSDAAPKPKEQVYQPQQVATEYGPEAYSNVLTMEATAYLPSDGGGSGITASGMAAGRGVVAVDPDVIPLGTHLYIPGYGMAIAADTGGAICGDRIDLCMESYGEAMQFGRRDITVYVLS